MKNIKYYIILITTSILLFSCYNDEAQPFDNEEKTNLSNISRKSLDNINNPLLSNQIPKSKEQIVNMLSENYNNIFENFDLNNIEIDLNDIYVTKKESFTLYDFNIFIPNKLNNKLADLYARLSISIDTENNISNKLDFGYNLDYTIIFNEKGNLNSNLSKYSTPKPSNIPSKAPKSVVCNYFNQNFPYSTYSYLYCGGSLHPYLNHPAPQEVLDALNTVQLTHNINNLHILSPNSPNGRIPFYNYTAPYQYSIRSEIESFYQKVFVIQANSTFTVQGNITQAVHVHKQAFIDSYFNWLFSLQYQSPNIYNYLQSNNSVMRQVFNVFADYNLNNAPSEGVYIGIPYGQYAQNQNLKCLSKVSVYLSTNDGLLLMQQLGSGSITLDQFKNQLNNLLCN